MTKSVIHLRIKAKHGKGCLKTVSSLQVWHFMADLLVASCSRVDKRTGSWSVASETLDAFDVFVHAANTIAIFFDFKADEALVAPPGAPGVLNFPVVAVTFHISLKEACFNCLACVPPLCDSAYSF